MTEGFTDIQINVGVDMTWTNTYQLAKITPLHVAAWTGMASFASYLLGSGAESNTGDGQLRTPLSWASAKGHTEVVASLLKFVTDPDVDDDHGLKPLHYAALGNHHKIVKLLLDSGISRKCHYSLHRLLCPETF